MTVEGSEAPVGAPTIGCDYNAHGFSIGVTKGPKVLQCGTINLNEDDVKTSFDLLVKYLQSLQYHHLASLNVYVEKPWMRSVQGKRGDTGLFTMRSATILELAVYQANMNPVFVYPQTWRKVVYGHGRPEDTKLAAIEYVQEELQFDLPVMGKTGRGNKPDHNIAEAICISIYGGRCDYDSSSTSN